MIRLSPGWKRLRHARPVPSPAIAAGLALAALSGGALAQTGIEAFNGNWVGAEVVAAGPGWPEMAAGAVAVAINGDNSDFEAEWMSLTLDEGALEWDLADTEFERDDRPGYYRPEDDADILDGEGQLWAFYGDVGLVLGRLQIDADSGRHIVYVCRLVPTEAGLEAHLTLTTGDSAATTATVAMVRR